MNWKDFGRTAYTGARTVALGTNVASIALWRRPVAAYRYCNTALFVRDSLAGRQLQEKRIDEFFPAVRNCAVEFPELSKAWSWRDPSYLADLVHLAILCHAVRPRRVFEIGTSTGYTSLLMAANTGDDTQILTLDLPSAEAATEKRLTAFDRAIVRECHQNDPCFIGHPLGRKIQRLFGDSARFDFSPYVGNIDLFFVDGAHTYEYVKSDTLRAFECCMEGGVVAWHDYGRPGLSRGVTTWLNELCATAPVYCTPGSSVAFSVRRGAAVGRKVPH